MRNSLWVMGALAAALVGCATAGPSSGDDDDDDASGISADADPNKPDSGTPVGDIDAAANCPTSPCDLFEQCGCASPSVCDLDLANLGQTSCRPVNSPGMEGSSCAALTDCAGGYVCVDGSCSQYCALDIDCGNPRRKCKVTLSAGGTPIPGAVTCSSACEPPNAALGGLCPAGYSCHLAFEDPDADPTSGDEIAFATCGTAGAATQGEACTTNGDCAVDHLCIGPAPNTCARMCTLTPAGSECGGVTTCTGLVPSMDIAGTVYGACL